MRSQMSAWVDRSKPDSGKSSSSPSPAVPLEAPPLVLPLQSHLCTSILSSFPHTPNVEAKGPLRTAPHSLPYWGRSPSR